MNQILKLQGLELDESEDKDMAMGVSSESADCSSISLMTCK